MRKRHDRAAVKREEAEERQADYKKLTPKQRLTRFDQKYGKGKGATKERAKLANK